MVRFSRIGRAGLVLAAALAALALASCSDYSGSLPKHMRPLDAKTRALVERKGMDLRSPILIRIFKEEATLEVWKQQKASGRYVFLKDYDICAWSGVLGPKIKEGDRQAPEGFYTIRPAQMNPDSNYYLAFNMGYPNEFDRSLGRTGSELMVHGACSSRGCYSMTDENIQEIYTLGRLAFQGGQREFQVEAFPFRMTPENIAKHRNDPNMPFWMMLKEGYDHFDVGPAAEGRRLRPPLHLQFRAGRWPQLHPVRRLSADVDAGADPHRGGGQGSEGQRQDAADRRSARPPRRRQRRAGSAGRDGDADLGRSRDAAADVGRRHRLA